MRSNSASRRPVLMLLLCGLLVAACCIGGSNPAAAFGCSVRRAAWPVRPADGAAAVAANAAAAFRRRLSAAGLPAGAVPPSQHPPIVGGGAVGGGATGGRRRQAAATMANSNGRGTAPVAQGDQPFIADEVVTAFAPNTTPQAIDQFARRYDLTQIETQNFPLIGASLYRWRIGGGRSVASVINALGSENIVASVQPNYIFTLQQASRGSPPARGRCGAICPRRTANRASASDRHRTEMFWLP